MNRMSFEQAVSYALDWGGVCYVFKTWNGFDWDIRSHGEMDVFCTIN